MTARSISDIDTTVNNRCVDGTVLKYYDGVTHMGVFGLPKEIRDSLKSETRIIFGESSVYALA